MSRGKKSRTFHQLVLTLCLMMCFAFVLFYYQRQSTQQALNEKDEAQPQPMKIYKRVQDPQLTESTEEVATKSFMEQQSRVQLKRHEYIREACAKHPHLRTGGISSTTRQHILVVDKHKLMYSFIPKTGCTNWKRLLSVMNGYRNRTGDITTAMAHKYFNNKKLSDYNQAEQNQRLENYTKFIFTRHPFERVLSAYGNKFATMDVYRESSFYQQIARNIMKKFRKDATPVQLKTGENITWVEWISYLTESRNNLLNDHWQEFFQLSSPCKINYDYIGKLDTISADSKYILTKLGMQNKVSYPSKSVSRPTNSSQSIDHHMSQLSQEKIQKLWEVYQLDFELFGYPKPQF